MGGKCGCRGCRDVLCNIVLCVEVLMRDSQREAKPVKWTIHIQDRGHTGPAPLTGRAKGGGRAGTAWEAC